MSDNTGTFTFKSGLAPKRAWARPLCSHSGCSHFRAWPTAGGYRTLGPTSGQGGGWEWAIQWTHVDAPYNPKL